MNKKKKCLFWVKACVRDHVHFGHWEHSGNGAMGRGARLRDGHGDHHCCPAGLGDVVGDPAMERESGLEFFEATGERSQPQGGSFPQNALNDDTS